MKKLTISIVNFNSGDHLSSCLESLEKLKNEIDFDVWIIDNGSSDNSLTSAEKKYKYINFIKNSKNLGFSKAHNLVLKKAKTPYLLTLNPDTIVSAHALPFMVDFMEKNPKVGAATCRIEKEDGTLDMASHRGFPTPKASFYYFFLKNNKFYHLTDKDMEEVHEVDSIVGAFMLLRKSVLEEVGYFDEDYFLYGEDIDLCFRIKEKGYKVMYVPQVKILHIKGASSGIKKHSRESSIANSSTKNLAMDSFYDSMKIFYKKHYAHKYPAFANISVFLAIELKKFISRGRKIV